jgi:hypothetical protein
LLIVRFLLVHGNWFQHRRHRILRRRFYTAGQRVQHLRINWHIKKPVNQHQNFPNRVGRRGFRKPFSGRSRPVNAKFAPRPKFANRNLRILKPIDFHVVFLHCNAFQLKPTFSEPISSLSAKWAFSPEQKPNIKSKSF